MKNAILLALVAACSSFAGASAVYWMTNDERNQNVSAGVLNVKTEHPPSPHIEEPKTQMIKDASNKEELNLAINGLVESQSKQHQTIKKILERLNQLEQQSHLSSPTSEPEPITEEELIAQAEAQQIAAQNAFYNDELDMASQPFDSPWATEMRHALQKIQSDKVAGDMGIKILDSECRSKTCRVEFDVQGAAAVNPALLIPLVTTIPNANMKMMKVDDGPEPKYVALFESATQE